MTFQRGGCVYLVTNQRHTTFYIGVTSDLVKRIWEHKNKVYPQSFTAKYNCNKLVYYCFYPSIEEAIAVEKALKGSNRVYKIGLVNKLNSTWTDLYDLLVEE